MKGDTILRQAALDALDQVAQMFPYRIPGNAKTYRQYNEAWNDAIDAAETAIEALPPAQPNLDEWCTDCKEYNTERHSCPRWNRVIRQTVDDLKAAQQWIPCTPETMPITTDVYLVKVSINQYGEGMYPTYRTALWHTVWRKWFVHEKEDSIIGEVTAWMPIPNEGGQT